MAINLILFAIIIIQQSLHFIERRDMLNRFSSSTHTEKPSKKPPKHIPSAHEQVLKRWRSNIPNKAGED